MIKKKSPCILKNTSILSSCLSSPNSYYYIILSSFYTAHAYTKSPHVKWFSIDRASPLFSYDRQSYTHTETPPVQLLLTLFGQYEGKGEGFFFFSFAVSNPHTFLFFENAWGLSARNSKRCPLFQTRFLRNF